MTYQFKALKVFPPGHDHRTRGATEQFKRISL